MPSSDLWGQAVQFPSFTTIFVLAITVGFIFSRAAVRNARPPPPPSSNSSSSSSEMHPPIPAAAASSTPAASLADPLDTPYTPEEVAKRDGVQSDEMWVGIKGTLFDVTANPSTYGPGKGYHLFVGKDSSRALGKSSLKAEDCTDDCSDFTPEQQETLDKWFAFFQKRYNIVGKIVKTKA
ncbi:MAG: cytochrome b5 [Piptocephalis tieghemiana]|nr:MAG: cytochrome b5 [Piptocephalis tieghemiana]